MIKLVLFTLIFFSAPFIEGKTAAYAQGFEFGTTGEEEAQKDLVILNPYDDKYRPNPRAGLSQKNRPPSPLPEALYDIQMATAITGREGDFFLKLQNIGSVTGCLDVQKPEIIKETMGKKLTVEISENVVTADESKPRYAHYSCDIQKADKMASILLNRDSLLRSGIQELSIEQKDVGLLALFDLEIHDHKIRATQILPAPTLQDGDGVKTVWFTPPGTLKLFNGSLKTGDEAIRSQILNLARQRGLTPIDEINPGFAELQDKTGTHIIVVDTDNRFADNFENLYNVFTLGNISINQLYTGPNGTYERAVEKPIFAKLAGAAE